MKFAKTLEDLMVPEWRTRYVEYKIGKKRIKATTINLRNASPSPALTALRRTASRAYTTGDAKTGTAPTLRARGLSILRKPPNLPMRSPNLERTPQAGHGEAVDTPSAAPPFEASSLQPAMANNTFQPIPDRRSSVTYGSVGISPSFSDSQPSKANSSRSTKPPSLQLPDPIQPIGLPTSYNPENTSPLELSSMSIRSATITPATPGTSSGDVMSRPVVTRRHSMKPKNLQNNPPDPPLFKRILSLGRVPVSPTTEEGPTIDEVQAEAEKEFLKWLLGELKKCEDFYVARESEAMKRFDEIREQLDIMRDRWFKAKHNIPFEDDDVEDVTDSEAASGPEGYVITATDTGTYHTSKRKAGWKSFADAMNGFTRPSPTTAQVNTAVMHIPEGNRDYVRRPPARKPLNNPAHRVAKRKLKRAYIEYYHGLEMLKSYVTVNRECFRKITKKFDKSSGLRTSHRFMTEYVDKSRFGSADNELDHMLNDTELLFARFFERGNRKEASSRLRSRENKTQYYSSVWNSGFYIGVTLIIGIYGLHQAILKLEDRSNPERAERMGYLLQLWGGVALLLAQALLFAINLRVWANNKINYAFIFEFDLRHQLNYRQFLEFPALLSLIFAICLWFSSYDFWDGRMDMIYWPIIYVSIAAALLLNPFQFCYFHSRRWLLRTLWRLFLSGAYPVEFTDFWMGDMLCSQTYAIGNISLFFCLYANSWENPVQCNSNHSRLMGFFTALPGIWRLLQCLRRYYNSKMWFPHLVNGGKYLFTVLHYMSLSIWRLNINHNPSKAAFIACASINSIYTTIWDVGMDWSLLDPYAKKPFLRKHLGFKHVWPYYLAMFVDPIIRCNWFFYIIYAGQVQHSAMLSFMLALAEVLRRFMWCFFRMENEHVGNVGANRAFRDLPLPYHLPAESPSSAESEGSESIDVSIRTGSELDLERMGTVRRRIPQPSPTPGPGSPIARAMSRVGRTVNQAHFQDYERRRMPQEEEETEMSGDSDDEEDGEDYYERTREAEGARIARSGTVGSRA